MRIYWRLKRLPELAGIPCEEHLGIWREAYLSAHKGWRIWVTHLAFGIGIASGIEFGDVFHVGFWGRLLMAGLIGGFVGLILVPVRIAMVRPFMK